jgi:hypothetical protein
MRWIRYLLVKLWGAYYRAPLAVLVIGIVSVLGMIGWIVGMKEERNAAQTAPPPAVSDLPPSPMTAEKKAFFLRMPSWELIDAVDQAPPKPAGEVAARLMWLLHVPIDGTKITREDVLNQIRPLCNGPLYDDIESKYGPSFEDNEWDHIRVMTVNQFEPDWWMVFVTGEIHGSMDAGLFMEVRKEGDHWIVNSLHEPGDGKGY